MIAPAQNKKVTAALALFAVSGLLFAGSVARYVSSDPIDELTERVEELKAIVAELRTQVTESGTSFTADLTYGDDSEDVRRLQIFLNQDPRTRVAVNGSGSPGQETTYFGVRTQGAVKRYQTIHREEILAPEQLTSATGYVGPRTRAHINAARTPNNETERSQPTTTDEAASDATPDFTEGLPDPEVDPGEVTEVHVANISSASARSGERVTLTGYGFTEADNTVRFDETYIIEGLSSQNGTRLSVPVPEDAEPGVYNLFVTNENGTSDGYIFLIVYEGNPTPPSVSHITPKEGPYGTEITIHGSGFSREKNQIRASYAVINDIPSPDGKTLTFKVKPVFGDVVLEEGKSTGSGHEVDFYFFVVNENGVSTQPVSFVWKI